MRSQKELVRQNSKSDFGGFTAVEGLLVVLVVAVVGFGGYYVWNNQSKKDSNNSQSASTSSNTTNKPSNKTSSTQYLIIKEWGVRAKSNSAYTLKYVIDSEHPNWAAFTSDELLAAGNLPGCGISKSDDGAGNQIQNAGDGFIQRYKSDEQVQSGGGIDIGQTAKQSAEADPSNWAHVGNYYYSYAHPQASCDDGVDTVQTQSENAVKDLLNSLEVLPS